LSVIEKTPGYINLGIDNLPDGYYYFFNH